MHAHHLRWILLTVLAYGMMKAHLALASTNTCINKHLLFVAVCVSVIYPRNFFANIELCTPARVIIPARVMILIRVMMSQVPWELGTAAGVPRGHTSTAPTATAGVRTCGEAGGVRKKDDQPCKMRHGLDVNGRCQHHPAVLV